MVPGRKNVTLGWDTDKCSLGEGVLEGLQKEFSSGHEYYAAMGQFMSCPAILLFIASQRKSDIRGCRKIIFAIGVSFG